MEDIMQKITLKIDGMMCGMCESHINDAIRRAYESAKPIHFDAMHFRTDIGRV